MEVLALKKQVQEAKLQYLNLKITRLQQDNGNAGGHYSQPSPQLWNLWIMSLLE